MHQTVMSWAIVIQLESFIQSVSEHPLMEVPEGVAREMEMQVD